MSATPAATRVAGEMSEVDRITREYRQSAFDAQRPPTTIYDDAHVSCPWPECTRGIRLLAFNGWEISWDAQTRARLLRAFWIGDGLAGDCPTCGRLVRFALTTKQTATPSDVHASDVLPADWVHIAQVLPRSE